MGNRTLVTDRGVEGRVTGYGDRVVAQGDTATRLPGGDRTRERRDKRPPAPPALATITIYDPKARLKGSAATAIGAYSCLYLPSPKKAHTSAALNGERDAAKKRPRPCPLDADRRPFSASGSW
jgi:hypothetical protein